MPSLEEILVLMQRQEMICTVHCPGAPACSVAISSHTTAEEVRGYSCARQGAGGILVCRVGWAVCHSRWAGCLPAEPWCRGARGCLPLPTMTYLCPFAALSAVARNTWSPAVAFVSPRWPRNLCHVWGCPRAPTSLRSTSSPGDGSSQWAVPHCWLMSSPGLKSKCPVLLTMVERGWGATGGRGQTVWGTSTS